jgi:purine-binding chemotaxis protein CheW
MAMTTQTLERPSDVSLPEEASAGTGISDVRQFVTFAVGKEIFAVNMVLVQEIMRVPEVVRVPLAPPTLEGLANLRGKVLPIISLRGLFGFEEKDDDDATRVLVVDVGQSLGFVVDRVASVVEVEPDQIEDVGSISSSVDADLLSGLIKDVGGHAMIMILDFSKLVEREFMKVSTLLKSTQGPIASGAAEVGDAVVADEQIQLVSFHVDAQEYAVPITEVQEIVEVPASIIRVPHSKTHVLGVMTLRNRLLPVVSLRRLFGLADRELDEKSRIVVLVFEGASVGLAVDGVNEVLRVAKFQVDPLPPLLSRELELAEIAEICRLDEGRRLVSIITVSKLFGQASISEALKATATIAAETAQAEGGEVTMEEDEQVVVFRLAKEEFGVPIANVEEIVRVPEELARVPKAPAFVEGVINLRGTVLPVLDLRLRMGMPRVERSDRQRIMVFRISGVRTGFIVDQVAEVLRIPKLSIEPAPRLSTEQGRLLSRVANLEKQKRIVQLLDPTHLVEGRELQELAAVTTEDQGDQATDR